MTKERGELAWEAEHAALGIATPPWGNAHLEVKTARVAIERAVRNAALDEAAILLGKECARFLDSAKSQPEKALSFGTAAEALARMGEATRAMQEPEA